MTTSLQLGVFICYNLNVSWKSGYLPDAKVGGGAAMGVFPPLQPESSGIRGDARANK